MNEMAGLIVDVEARITKLERGLAKANQTQRKAARQMEATARDNARRIGAAYDGIGAKMQGAFAGASGFLRVGGGLLAGSAVARSARAFTRLADEATAMRNALSNAGLEGAELSRVYEQLFKSAQKNSAPVGALVDLYSKLALTQNELGVSSGDLIRFTDGIAVALKVAGTDATAASGALLQLSQALGGGIVRAEEFNSILEGVPTIAQAVARGLKEAGGSVAELRKLVVDGEVSSAAFFRAFEVGSAELRQQAANSQSTVGQAMTRIGNSLVTAAGDFDQASGASENLARMIGETADAVDRFDAAGMVNEISEIADAFREAEEAAASWLQRLGDAQVFADLNEAMGITENGQLLNPDVREAEQKIDRLDGEVEILQAAIENNTELGFDNSEAIARLREVRAELAALKAEAASLPRHIAGLKPDGTVVHDMQDSGTFITGYEAPPIPIDSAPVSVEDYPAGGSASGGSGGRSGGRSGGGGGRSVAPKPDDYAREVEKIKERTQALQLETAQLVLASSGERDLGEAMDIARAKADLLSAAQQAGKQVTPELGAQIDALADSYVRAAQSADEAANRIQRVQDNARTGAETTADLFMSATESADNFKAALIDLARTIIRNQILKLVSGLPGMGAIGAALAPPTGFADGGFTGPGSKYQVAGVVHAGEYVMSAEATKRIGASNLESLHRAAKHGYAEGGLVGATGKVSDRLAGSTKSSRPMQISITGGPITVNGSAGTEEQNADLAKQMARESEAMMRGLIQTEIVKQMRPGGMLR